MAAFFGLFLHFFNFSDPVVLRDRAAEIDGVSLGIFGEIADIRFFAEPAREFTFEVFGENVDENAPDQERNGNDRHDQRKWVEVLDGGKYEAERYERTGELSGVFCHFDEPQKGGAGLVHEVDAVAHGRDKNGQSQSHGDQAQQDDAQGVPDGAVVIDGIHRIQRVSAEKYTAENESRFFYFCFETHCLIIIHGFCGFGKHFVNKKVRIFLKSAKSTVVCIFHGKSGKSVGNLSRRRFILKNFMGKGTEKRKAKGIEGAGKGRKKSLAKCGRKGNDLKKLIFKQECVIM